MASAKQTFDRCPDSKYFTHRFVAEKGRCCEFCGRHYNDCIVAEADPIERFSRRLSLDTHYVPIDAPGRTYARALCGRLVEREVEHELEPTCAMCRTRLEELEQITI